MEVLRAGGECEALPGMVDGVGINAGDVVRLTTTGGGGWGDPLQRDPVQVRYDVLCGNVSHEAALDQYGVVLKNEDGALSIDEVTTREYRENLARERGGMLMFDRGEHFQKEKARGQVDWPQGWEDPDDCLAGRS